MKAKVRSSTAREAWRALALVSGMALTAGMAGAHGEEGVDLDAMVERVGEQLPLTQDDKKVNRSYAKLAKVLGKEPRDFADIVKKLAAVSRECSKTLSGDITLRGHLDHAIDEARTALEGKPEDVELLVDGILGDKNRGKVEKLALKARSLHESGDDAADSGDEKKRLSLYGKSGKTWDKAERLAEKIIDSQGGPLPQFLTPTAGNIYTFVGTGEAGHNGEGRPQRRSSLYWVEEIKFGPDGRLYVMDWNNHMVRVLENDGTMSRLCGAGVPGDSEGPAATTEFNHPSSLDFAADGRVFIGAWHNHKVKVFDPMGPGEEDDVIYTIAGGPAGNAGNGGPATAANYNLLPGVLLLPEGHPFGGGDLLTTDATNQVIRIVRLASDPVTAVNVAGVTVQTGTVDRIFGTTGVQGHGGDGGLASAATLGFSKSQNAESDGRMTMDADGNIYVVSGAEHCVRKILAADGTITTVAGNGTPGYSGDGGSATSAQLNFPGDMAVAADGTVFISDQGNHVIRKVSPEGIITTIAGTAGTTGYTGDEGPASAALLNRPTGLELDADGNLYICDKANSVIRVIAGAAAANPGALMVPRTPYRLPRSAHGLPPERGESGTIATFAGTGKAGFNGDNLPARQTEFYWPQDITVTPETGQLLIVDWNNHRIRRIEADGTVAPVMGRGELGDTSGPALDIRMNHPTDLAFNPADGELYVAGWHIDRIKKLTSASNTVSTWNKPDGRRTFSGDNGLIGSAELNLPSSIKFDSSGNAYIADEGNGRVRFVDFETGIITTIVGTGERGFGGDGQNALLAKLNLPVGQSAQPAGRICLDPTEQYLYIADTDNHRLRRVDLETMIITTVAANGTPGFAGDGGDALLANLKSPVDVDCDAEGNVYICDRDNHAVRRLDIETGVLTTVAGSGAQGYSGDGRIATEAQLFLPAGIYVDRSNGRLYIADTFNSVIRVVWE